MEPNPENKSVTNLKNAGLILIPVMLLILFVSGRHRILNGDILNNSGVFFVNYIIAVIYFLGVLIKSKSFFEFRRIDKRLIILILIHFSISSFTLNNAIAIFAGFTLWTKIYLILFYAAFLSVVFIDKIPVAVRYCVYFFLGSGVVMTCYFAVYLASTYILSLVGLVFLGISVHLLIPLLTTITVVIVFSKLNKTKADIFFFLAGVIIPVLISVGFLFHWNNFKKDIHQATSSVITRPDNTLPEWVLLCQEMPTDKFSKKIIKGNLIYQTFKDMWGRSGMTVFDEVKRHDPLVNLGIAILGETNLDRKTRVRILKSQFNARHLAQRKLWSGRDIGTIEVLNNIQVFPDYRIAYSEKIITVKNFHQRQNNQQEAAFTFYLPEGSVATSLSLWINGKEEKSRLTTKSKADSAYVSIVGVEMRDPALMHWQEGNTLTVTVFPCTPAENRRFKIGVTTPLEKDGDILRLQNVYFDGPVTRNILETSQIVFASENEVQNINLPDGFKKGIDSRYEYKGEFRPYWEVTCKATELSKDKFYFDNYSYSIHETEKKTYDFVPTAVYLDINKSWSKSEYKRISEIFADKEIYVHHDKLIKVREDNRDEIFKVLGKKNFSLFPFNVISDLENTLVISKSTELSPNLSDLEGSDFLKQLYEDINAGYKKVNLYQIGSLTSPYLKSLKEFQILNFHSGGIEKLPEIVEKGVFYKYDTDSSEVNLEIAGISIQKSAGMSESKAPDHLMRLFAYNSLMKQMGRNYFNKDDDYIDSLAAIAEKAYIVSPVSSLIVLETVKDYERFDIPENENSLKNASVKSSGAVPEPAERLLIFLFIVILVIIFLKMNQLKFMKWKKD